MRRKSEVNEIYHDVGHGLSHSHGLLHRGCLLHGRRHGLGLGDHLGLSLCHSLRLGLCLGVTLLLTVKYEESESGEIA